MASCQTYEGGIGATPGEEAHGGYTFFGLAAMVLLGGAEQLRLPQLAHWLCQRQMEVHGRASYFLSLPSLLPSYFLTL